MEDGGKQGQRAVEHRSREDALPVAPDAPAHSSFSITLLRLSSVPSCKHLTARPSQGHHLMIVCWKQKEKSTETRQKYSSRFPTERREEVPHPEAELSTLYLNVCFTYFFAFLEVTGTPQGEIAV